MFEKQKAESSGKQQGSNLSCQAALLTLCNAEQRMTEGAVVIPITSMLFTNFSNPLHHFQGNILTYSFCRQEAKGGVLSKYLNDQIPALLLAFAKNI